MIFTESQAFEMRQRNEARAKQLIEQMGRKYVCHPDNQITKQKFRKVLRRSKKLQLNCL
jgi:phage gp29-like protein